MRGGARLRLGVLFIFLFSEARAATYCEQLAAQPWLPGRRLTAGVELAVQKPIDGMTYWSWTSKDLEAHRGQTLYLDEGPAAPNHVRVPGQEVLSEVEDFSADERALIRTLEAYRHDRHRLQRARVKADPTSGERLSHEEDTAEVGAWRLTLKDGRVLTALVTSDHFNKITGEAGASALTGMATRNGITPEDVVVAQFFHTHPSHNGYVGTPLSEPDLDMTRNVKSRLFSGAGVEVHVYAIVKAPDTGGRYVFHFGL